SSDELPIQKNGTRQHFTWEDILRTRFGRMGGRAREWFYINFKKAVRTRTMAKDIPCNMLDRRLFAAATSCLAKGIWAAITEIHHSSWQPCDVLLAAAVT
ncbi:hypothetical protein ACJX0J_040684, partial [Zea mays]